MCWWQLSHILTLCSTLSTFVPGSAVCVNCAANAVTEPYTAAPSSRCRALLPTTTSGCFAPLSTLENGCFPCASCSRTAVVSPRCYIINITPTVSCWTFKIYHKAFFRRYFTHRTCTYIYMVNFTTSCLEEYIHRNHIYIMLIDPDVHAKQI